MGPLEGTRIIDLSRLLPGPYATRVLAELGAEVIKVEHPSGGDYLRWAPPRVGDPPYSGLFRALNDGKKSVTLDLQSEDGKHAFRALISTADVLFDTFRPGVLTKLELSPSDLMASHPQLIYCALTGFGLNGPERDRPGHDISYIARSGGLSLSGPEADPAPPGVQVADIGGALAAVSGILAALFERTRTGRGRVVDVSLAEASLGFSTVAFGLRSAGHRPRRGREALDGSLPSYTVYRTKDGGHLAVGALEPRFWEALVNALGLPHLKPSGLERGPAGADVRAQVQQVLAEQTTSEWREILRHVDTCIEPVQSIDEALEDPHFLARGSVRTDGSLSGPVRLADADSAFDDPSAAAPPRLFPVPLLGAHTREVLKEAGVDAAVIRRLTATEARLGPSEKAEEAQLGDDKPSEG